MGKGIMFMLFMWLMVCLAGSVMAGDLASAVTVLTSPLGTGDSTVYVQSTNGFSDSGTIVIGTETIAYSRKTATTFYGDPLIKPLLRGVQGTEEQAHATGSRVYTAPMALLNNVVAYNIIYMSNPEGVLAVVGVPIAFFQTLGGFFFLPLSFLGTDLQILSILWMVIAFGMIIALAIALVGRS